MWSGHGDRAGDAAAAFPSAEAVLVWLRELPAPVAVAYEAGPTGFDLARQLVAAGVRCVVAAPSKLQRPAGDRIKTDARDALLLARLLRMDEIVQVRVPSIEQEAARDLVRAREDARGDLMRCRHRVSKLLLRHGIVYSGGHPCNGATRRGFGVSDSTSVASSSRSTPTWRPCCSPWTAVTASTRPSPRWPPMVNTLPSCGGWVCLRGVSTLTAFGLAVEVGDWHRFTGATIGAYLGLVPTESSSGQQRCQGSITKAGNTHARRLLVEAAWHHRRDYRNPGATMRARWKLASPAATARGNAGNHRLHQRWENFVARKKKTVIANVAVARELAGWCWSLAVLDD
ncbi:transposase [Micromonospora zamorensis]|uniref:transposase n=1 Tax=Micromonospora zamorensis TaxID=709883 RepID=UPI003D8EEB4F